MTYKGRPLSQPNLSSEYTCGLGSWRPKWLQIFGTTKFFMFIFGGIGIIQGAAFTYMIASITTLEKRYAFGSKMSGLILIADNVTELTLSPLLGYIANRCHRPRMIGYCQIIVAIGSFLAAVPYFVYGPGVHLLGSSSQQFSKTNKTIEFCDQNRYSDSNECDKSDDYDTSIPVVIILWIASFFNGVGFVAFYTIGVPFIDDNVKKKNSPLYLSLTSALRLCGPTLGFILSSYCLTFYENPFIDPGIDMKDPRWVGAWWIGFIVIGVGITIFTIPMFFFPQNFIYKIPTKEKNIDKPLIRNGFVKSQQKSVLWIRTKRLVTNPILICYTLGTAARLFAVLGYFTFKAKYIESQYKTSASTANLFSGIVGVVPSAIGIFLGGLYISKCLPGPKMLTTFVTVVELIGVTGMLSALFLGCPESQFAGTQTKSNLELQSMCNDNCFCSTKVLQPICSPDNQTNYFSPCFAGCRPQSMSNQTKEYSDCDCFEGMATDGYCPNDCGNNFHIYILLLGISNILGNLAKTGNKIISFRIVDEEDKSFAIGVISSFLCLTAFIPYPLVYGAVTDSTCLIWESNCGHRGNCWVYDTKKFRQYLHGLTLGLYFVGSVFDVIVVFLSHKITNLYNDEITVPIEDRPMNIKLSSSLDKQLSELSEL